MRRGSYEPDRRSRPLRPTPRAEGPCCSGRGRACPETGEFGRASSARSRNECGNVGEAGARRWRVRRASHRPRSRTSKYRSPAQNTAPISLAGGWRLVAFCSSAAFNCSSRSCGSAQPVSNSFNLSAGAPQKSSRGIDWPTMSQSGTLSHSAAAPGAKRAPIILSPPAGNGKALLRSGPATTSLPPVQTMSQ